MPAMDRHWTDQVRAARKDPKQDETNQCRE